MSAQKCSYGYKTLVTEFGRVHVLAANLGECKVNRRTSLLDGCFLDCLGKDTRAAEIGLVQSVRNSNPKKVHI